MMNYLSTKQAMIYYWKYSGLQKISLKSITTIGESLKKETVELITLIYRANSKKEKFNTLQTTREYIGLLIRLMKDLKQISLKKFVNVNKQVENVSKQLIGWQKKQLGSS